MPYLTVEELRKHILEGIDSVLDAPWIIRKFVSNADRRLLRAQRRYWQSEDGTGLAKLLMFLDQEPEHRDLAEEAPSLSEEEWQVRMRQKLAGEESHT